ncbi:MAG: sigma 54-interacting transcriptional regulator [Glaciecola sp.]
MINAIDKPAIFINTQYVILAVNDAYRALYTNEVLIGSSHCYEISHNHQQPCDKHGEDCPIQQCISTQKTSSAVHIHHTEHGKTYCDIIMKPIKDSDGITSGFLEILDIIDFAATESRLDKMIGSSMPFKTMLTKIKRAASSNIAVLLQGETGTGKELVAQALHQSSARAQKPFVVIECTGLNENLFESELFGHEKGAFTGANFAKKGLIELANGGTVFFDEIADVPMSMQVKLLRLFESKSYRTVGGLTQKKADLRLVCASHKNLKTLVERGEFRQDLYYRIAGFPIQLPALSERTEDIPALAMHFLQQSDYPHKYFSHEAIGLIKNYTFPGNIRELKNIVEHAALMANEDCIEIDDLPEDVFQDTRTHSDSPINSFSHNMTLDQAEAHYLKSAMQQASQGIEHLAHQLGVSKRTLYRKLNKHNIPF